MASTSSSTSAGAAPQRLGPRARPLPGVCGLTAACAAVPGWGHPGSARARLSRAKGGGQGPNPGGAGYNGPAIPWLEADPMADEFPETVQLLGWLERMRAGDPAAREVLLEHVCERLRRLTRKMLKAYPGVQRWAQTDDVLQNALLRLLRALQDVQPASTREFLGLAATQVRRELLDLARHFYRPHGAGAHHISRDGEGPAGPGVDEPADTSRDPSVLAAWTELHERIERLPAEERETLDLLHYQGLPQADVAALLNVSVRTVQRRWQSALVKLHDLIQESLLQP